MYKPRSVPLRPAFFGSPVQFLPPAKSPVSLPFPHIRLPLFHLEPESSSNMYCHSNFYFDILFSVYRRFSANSLNSQFNTCITLTARKNRSSCASTQDKRFKHLCIRLSVSVCYDSPASKNLFFVVLRLKACIIPFKFVERCRCIMVNHTSCTCIIFSTPSR